VDRVGLAHPAAEFPAVLGHLWAHHGDRDGVLEPLQHEHDAALAAHVAVGARVEGLAAPVGGESPELLEEAIASDPTCLVAVDFLFWFCYGFLDAEGGRIDNESERLDLLEIGLGLLDAYGGPIVVGDLPDMSPAVGVMLSLSQLPEPETLKRANERIRAWADRRERVTVYPLSSLVEQVRSGAGVDLAGLVWTPEQARRFIQRDKLHPSVDGQLATAQIVLRLLDDRYEAVRPDDYLQNFDSVRAVLRERAP